MGRGQRREPRKDLDRERETLAGRVRDSGWLIPRPNGKSGLYLGDFSGSRGGEVAADGRVQQRGTVFQSSTPISKLIRINQNVACAFLQTRDVILTKVITQLQPFQDYTIPIKGNNGLLLMRDIVSKILTGKWNPLTRQLY